MPLDPRATTIYTAHIPVGDFLSSSPGLSKEDTIKTERFFRSRLFAQTKNKPAALKYIQYNIAQPCNQAKNSDLSALELLTSADFQTINIFSSHSHPNTFNMPSHAAAGCLARTFSSLHLSPPAERPSTPPSPEVPLSPSSASSFIMLTPPSPTLASPTLDSPIRHPPAPPSSPTEPEGRGRKRERSPSPSASLRFGRLRLTSPETSPTRSRSRSCSPRRDPSPANHRSRSPPADRPLTIPSDFEFSFSFSLDEEISALEYWDNLETEQFKREMHEIVEASACPPNCSCNPDLWEDAVADSFDWDSFFETLQIRRAREAEIE